MGRGGEGRGRDENLQPIETPYGESAPEVLGQVGRRGRGGEEEGRAGRGGGRDI